MNRITRMLAHLRERFTDWTPENIQIAPPAGASPTSDAGTTAPAPAKQPKPKLPPLWRLATVTNPKTGNPVVLDVRKDGSLFKGDAERFGITQAIEWHEVRATSRTEARQLIAEGKAETRTAQ